MDFRQLRYLVAVAKEGSYRRAAKALSITQPPISRQLAALEKELGAQLFVRRRGHVTPTEAGYVLLADAQRLIADMEKSVQMVKAVAAGERSVVRLGYSRLTDYGFLATVLRAISLRHPSIYVDFRTAALRLISRDIEDGILDVGITRLLIESPSLNRQILQRDSLLVALPEAWARSTTKVKLRSFEDKTFIVMGRRSAGQQSTLTERACLASGFWPPYLEEVEDLESALTRVSVGRGLAIIPKSLANRPLPGVRFLPIQGEQVPADMYLVWRKDGFLPHFRIVISAIIEMTGQHLGRRPTR